MAFEFITVNQTTDKDVNAADDVTLMPGVTVTSPDDGFQRAGGSSGSFAGTSITILGTVAVGDDGVIISDVAITEEDVRVVIGESGKIFAGGKGVIFADANNQTVINHGEIVADIGGGGTNADREQGILLGAGNDHEVVNTGAITGFGGIAIGAGNNHRVSNDGTVKSLFFGIDLSDGSNFDVFNTGTITADSGIATGDGDDHFVSNIGTINCLGFGIRLGEGNNHTLINSGDIHTSTQGILIGDGNSHFVTNSGTITSGSVAINILDGDNNVIRNTGLINAADNGIDIDAGNNNRVVNTGHILSSGDGIDLASGDNSKIVNTGEIDSEDGGIEVGVGGTVNNTEIVNRGGITAGTNGIVIGAGNNNTVLNFGDIISSFRAVNFTGGTGNLLENHGLISVAKASASGSDVSIILSGSPSDTGTLINTGKIVAELGIATDPLVFGDGINTIKNFGEMIVSFSTADAVAISLGSQADFVQNRGLIDGDIKLGGGADIFDGRRGTVDGEVRGEAGDDTYVISDADIELVEAAAEGTDLVESTVSYRLEDNFENLTLLTAKNINATGNNLANEINGNAGDNSIAGKAGGDVIRGGEGDDILRGNSGLDVLIGNEGNDKLMGGLTNDHLFGNEDDDILIGGRGADTLTGGDGDDIFVFSRQAHSTTTASDEVLDFEQGSDRLDFSGLAKTVDFLGAAGYSAGGDAELRIITAGANSFVFVDANGDGSSDMRVKVTGVTGLQEIDFIL